MYSSLAYPSWGWSPPISENQKCICCAVKTAYRYVPCRYIHPCRYEDDDIDIALIENISRFLYHHFYVFPVFPRLQACTGVDCLPRPECLSICLSVCIVYVARVISLNASSSLFQYRYWLQQTGWDRKGCVRKSYYRRTGFRTLFRTYISDLIIPAQRVWVAASFLDLI